MSAYLGSEPHFILEGPNGSCELWSDKLGYTLYFEAQDSYKPEVVSVFSSRERAIEDAFENAKAFVGLDDWRMNWFDIVANQAMDDWKE